MFSNTQHTPRYKQGDKLGEGTYASVYKGQNLESGQFVALKVIMIEESEGTPSTALREIALLKRLEGNRHILHLMETERSKTCLTLIFELCQQDLKKFMDGYKRPSVGHASLVPGPVPADIARDLTYQMLTGIQSMHDGHVMHRDLKPQNLLLTSDRTLKIGDFGLARSFGVPTNSYSNEVVTLWYRAPDVLMGSKSYGPSIDIWSAGCIMAELFLGIPLFRGRDAKDQLLAIFKILGTPDNQVLETICAQAREIPRPLSFPAYPSIHLKSLLRTASPEALDLMKKMLTVDPMKRITAAEARRHPYFKAPRHSRG